MPDFDSIFKREQLIIALNFVKNRLGPFLKYPFPRPSSSKLSIIAKVVLSDRPEAP